MAKKSNSKTKESPVTETVVLEESNTSSVSSENSKEQKPEILSYTHEVTEELFKTLQSKHGSLFDIKYSSCIQVRRMTREQAVTFLADWFSKQK
jgi:hypothetical protein